MLVSKKALEQVAKNHEISTNQVISEIESAIDEAMRGSDKAVRLFWEQVPREGRMPTAEELVAYITDILNGTR